MTVRVFTVVKDYVDVLPFFLRHYSAFAERIIVWDDASTDGSTELLKACPIVDYRTWPHPGSGIQEDVLLNFAQESYHEACGMADWVIWVDPDEFIYHQYLIGMLELLRSRGAQVIKPDGFNMMHEGMPHNDGRQIWEICKRGVPANCPWIVPAKNTGIKLLHYRYLGYEYTRKRNQRNYDRCQPDKGAAWSCDPNYQGEHSAEWAWKMLKTAKEVI
jgi:glycosyltransferase involved in cell wall biosynthesis